MNLLRPKFLPSQSAFSSPTQVLVDALIQLLQAESLHTHATAPAQNRAHLTSRNLKDQQTQPPSRGLGAAMDFIASLLSAGRVNVEPRFAMHLLRRVAEQQHQQQQQGTAPALAVTKPPSYASPSSSSPSVLPVSCSGLEALFVGMVVAVGVVQLGTRQSQNERSHDLHKLSLKVGG